MNASTVTSVVTSCIAAFVALIGFNQSRVSRDKLRLDLFNRRFGIYLCVLDYYVSLSRPQTDSDQPDKVDAFIKAIRESRFMFPPKSGVYPFLEELRTRANEVVNYTESLKILVDMPKALSQLTSKHLENTHWIQQSMSTLEDKIKPYVSFR